jgi:hypothetical protein
MHDQIINDTLAVLRSVVKNEEKAKDLLQRYWLNKIAVIWTTEDVHRAANERDLALTQKEAVQVLRYVFDHHDAQCGLKWEDITNRIEDRVLGRKMTKREVDRFVHRDIIAIQKSTKRSTRP